MVKTGFAFAISLCALAGTALAGEGATESKPAYADDPAVVAKLEALGDQTGMKLDSARLQGKDLEKWRQQFYRRGPENRNYCVKMVYNPDRQTAFFCGGNHGAPHKLADAWEYHLGSNTWTLLAPPEVGNPKGIIGLYFGYDAGNDVFLLCQPGAADKVRAFSLEKNEWTTPEIKGDGPPGNKNLQGYYDPDRNVLVACEGLSVWVYRYAKHKK